MKSQLFFLLAGVLFVSCQNDRSRNLETINPEMEFTSVSPNSMIKYTIKLTFDGDNVTATRSQTTDLDGFSRYHVLYINTDKVVYNDPSIELTANANKNVWFIPYYFEAEPVLLTENRQCLKYICACGGFPNTNGSNCCSANDQIQYIECVQSTGCEELIPSCPSACAGYTVTVDCTTQNIIEWTSGGVIVEGETLQVIDPERIIPISAPKTLLVPKDKERSIKFESNSGNKN